jgi:hypothetical protein
MDDGPFRVPRPADRRAVSRSEPQYRQQAEEPQPVRQQSPVPADTSARVTSAPVPKTTKRKKVPIIIAIIVLLLAAVGLFAFTSMNKNGGMAIDSSKYQAVFFTNGQVYFGKLSPQSDESLKLTDVFYLQTNAAGTAEANPQQTSSNESDVQLIKLGDEIHGPEDKMIISKDQVLFYENLKTDGKVANSISEYKRTHSN